MSRHNEVIFYGKMHEDPLIKKKNGTLTARFSLDTIIGNRDMGFYIDKLKYQQPWFLTKNPEFIKHLAEYHQNDMLFIKGVLTTEEIIKRVKCPSCQTMFPIEKANATYITPIFVKRIEKNVTNEKALELLKKSCEISNHATIIGTLCRNPESFTSKRGKMTTNYQLAVNRKYYIKEGDPLVRTDYPWVRSFDEIAKNDAQALKVNSEVLIDGFINSRIAIRKQTCPECDCNFEWKDLTILEIIPYSVEYLRNCKSIEEIRKEEDEVANRLADSILGN